MEEFKEIEVEEAKKLMEQGDISIMDIRDTDSYEADHIENAQSVNDTNIEEFVEKSDKNKPVLCYCYMLHYFLDSCLSYIQHPLHYTRNLLSGRLSRA